MFTCYPWTADAVDSYGSTSLRKLTLPSRLFSAEKHAAIFYRLVQMCVAHKLTYFPFDCFSQYAARRLPPFDTDVNRTQADFFFSHPIPLACFVFWGGHCDYCPASIFLAQMYIVHKVTDAEVDAAKTRVKNHLYQQVRGGVFTFYRTRRRLL